MTIPCAPSSWPTRITVPWLRDATAGTQTVDYHYDPLGSWSTLTRVDYQNDPFPATYTYQSYTPPSGFFYAGPLLASANAGKGEGQSLQLMGAGHRHGPSHTNTQFKI